jgi:hypothetical protein
VGLNPTASAFFIFVALVILSGLSAQGLGIAISAAAKNEKIALAIAPAVTIMLMLFGARGGVGGGVEGLRAGELSHARVPTQRRPLSRRACPQRGVTRARDELARRAATWARPLMVSAAPPPHPVHALSLVFCDRRWLLRQHCHHPRVAELDPLHQPPLLWLHGLCHQQLQVLLAERAGRVNVP